jgi:protein-S-isoprenylcysteine O-methyltransferase
MNASVFVWLINAAWIIVVVYLIVTARRAKPDTEGHRAQSLALVFALIAAVLLPRLEVFRFVNFAPVNAVLGSVGVIITGVGLALFVWARQTLGSNWSQTVSAKQGHELVTSGPYRYVRHPMYTGGLVACLGSAIVAGGAFVFLLVVLTPLFLWRVGAEDKLMTGQFPREYPVYKQSTKALIPFVW